MPRPETTPIQVSDSGDETHESWLVGHASRVSSTPGARLFDSEIPHRNYITLSFSTVSRKRDLHHDWLHPGREIIEVAMSEAQWGALVSSFGNGSGVPCTLEHHGGKLIPRPTTIDSRLDVSHREVKDKATEGMAAVKEAQRRVSEAFELKLGVKETRVRLATLARVIDQLPGNMEFAAKSMTEHVENVVTKARSDIEAMARNAVESGHELPASESLLLGPGGYTDA